MFGVIEEPKAEFDSLVEMEEINSKTFFSHNNHETLVPVIKSVPVLVIVRQGCLSKFMKSFFFVI